MIQSRTWWFSTLVLVCVATLVAACAGTPQQPPAASTDDDPPAISSNEDARIDGDATRGSDLFHGRESLENAPPCSSCHYVEAHQRILVGPNMAGIADRAGNRIEGVLAVEYLHESITNPDAYTVDGFPPGTMNQSYDNILSDDDINDLIAYLMTLSADG